jgi:hypothetical protein
LLSATDPMEHLRSHRSVLTKYSECATICAPS